MLEACKRKDTQKLQGAVKEEDTKPVDAEAVRQEMYESSSSEDTSDEKYTALHSVEEEKERALEESESLTSSSKAFL